MYDLLICYNILKGSNYMRAKQWAQGYPLDIPPETIHQDDYSQLIPEAQDWSYAFGRQLYADLSGVELESTHPMEDERYFGWLRGFDELENNLVAVNTDDSLHALNEINFHAMNACMRGNWRAIHEGGWRSEGDRLHKIAVAERTLAINGFTYYAWREQSPTEALFEGDRQDLRRALNGRIQEFDAALVCWV